MEVVQVLHMNGGVGATSYANNSLLQKKVITMTKPIWEEAITKLYTTSFPAKLVIADLGCSSGPNTLLVASEFIKIVSNICKKLGSQSPEFQVLLNDLPGNDFNTIFRSLPRVQEKLRKQMGCGAGHCFFSGVPGSFYGRLFPGKSVNIFHSSYSLHWLSQVPEGLESNKGNIFMASTSPPCVLKAYYQQFQKDFSLFLKCRSEELVAGGRMVLTLLGRRSDDPSSKECSYIWELMAIALNEMASEGIIEEEKVDSFNIPVYSPSPSEIKCEVMKEGSFEIDRIEVTQVNWDAYNNEFKGGNVSQLQSQDRGYNVAQCIRAVAEPLLISHFGEAIIDEVFSKYGKIVADRMAKEKTEFVNITISLVKSG
ncbi:S-adenosyl-L-methionine:benzoic acid/salicylic acid carboxyl methyltransferase 2-like [Mangifera indica]|uniref:S-adenosyl-L-methionine:benzoic acid/salicylic acid carboxyl methyltransferase 2-like n=1 Tax=Mangifera indica TaxID=29780 RepID=UPI001CF9B347|nr:S-adenosyl-L-methionine:benzoic acid/salicylic acid carboxyl methyltransferase 2-like [Mangifera indica]